MTRSHRILHVDDDAETRLIVQLSLGLDPDITVLGAGSEEEVYASLLAGAGFQPTALLLDDRIGELTGVELASRLRRRPALSAVPLLFLTGRINDRAGAEMRAAGAAGVLYKPFDPIRLAADVRAYLDR